MVDLATEDNDYSNATANRSPSALIKLPDELAEWADQNGALIQRVQNALNGSYASLTEDQIWETIAATCCPEWQEARENLRNAQKIWDDFHHPVNRPLGAIGQALDSDKTDSVQSDYAVSLSQFTIINEGLLQRPDLRNLLSVLLVQKRMVEQSSAQTMRTAIATDKLGYITSPRHDFNHAARAPSALLKQFRRSIQRILPKKRFAVTSVTAPWSPKT